MSESHEIQSTILFTGGCHVYAYGIEEQQGFVPATIDLLSGRGRRPQARILAPVSPKQRQRILDAIRKWNPDVLVLQLGHWESTQPLPLPACSRGFSEKLKSSVRALVPRDLYWLAKTAYDRLSPRAHVDRALIGGQYAALFEAVAGLRLPEVVLLEPFPALEPVVRRYRRILAEIIEEQNARYRFRVVRVAPAFHRTGYPAVHPEYFLRDGMHLSAKGHALVARLLATSLSESEVLNRNVHSAA